MFHDPTAFVNARPPTRTVRFGTVTIGDTVIGLERSDRHAGTHGYLLDDDAPAVTVGPDCDPVTLGHGIWAMVTLLGLRPPVGWSGFTIPAIGRQCDRRTTNRRRSRQDVPMPERSEPYEHQPADGRRTTIVPGVAVVDPRGPGDEVYGVCVATDARHVVYRVTGGGMEVGTLNMVEWLICWVQGQKPEAGRLVRPPASANADDHWLRDWAEALFRLAVRDRLAYHATTIGTLTPEQFLITVLDDWDCLDGPCKRDSLLHAVGAYDQVDGGWEKRQRGHAPAEGGGHD